MEFRFSINLLKQISVLKRYSPKDLIPDDKDELTYIAQWQINLEEFIAIAHKNNLKIKEEGF